MMQAITWRRRDIKLKKVSLPFCIQFLLILGSRDQRLDCEQCEKFRVQNDFLEWGTDLVATKNQDVIVQRCSMDIEGGNYT